MNVWSKIIAAVWAVLVVGLCVYTTYLMLDLWAASGPCPGAPEWLGRCDDPRRPQ